MFATPCAFAAALMAMMGTAARAAERNHDPPGDFTAFPCAAALLRGRPIVGHEHARRLRRRRRGSLHDLAARHCGSIRRPRRCGLTQAVEAVVFPVTGTAAD